MYSDALFKVSCLAEDTDLNNREGIRLARPPEHHPPALAAALAGVVAALAAAA